MLPNDPREVVDSGPVTPEKLQETVGIGEMYKTTQKTPGWQHYRDFILSRIELLDKQADTLGDERFNEFRAIRTEMRVLHHLIKLFQVRIDAGERAKQQLQELQERKRRM